MLMKRILSSSRPIELSKAFVKVEPPMSTCFRVQWFLWERAKMRIFQEIRLWPESEIVVPKSRITTKSNVMFCPWGIRDMALIRSHYDPFAYNGSNFPVKRAKRC